MSEELQSILDKIRWFTRANGDNFADDEIQRQVQCIYDRLQGLAAESECVHWGPQTAVISDTLTTTTYPIDPSWIIKRVEVSEDGECWNKLSKTSYDCYSDDMLCSTGCCKDVNKCCCKGKNSITDEIEGDHLPDFYILGSKEIQFLGVPSSGMQIRIYRTTCDQIDWEDENYMLCLPKQFHQLLIMYVECQYMDVCDIGDTEKIRTDYNSLYRDFLRFINKKTRKVYRMNICNESGLL